MSADNNKSMKNYPACKELMYISGLLVEKPSTSEGNLFWTNPPNPGPELSKLAPGWLWAITLEQRQ